MKIRLLFFTIVCFFCVKLYGQGIQRDVMLLELNTTRSGLKEFQLGNFNAHKVRIIAKKGYLSQIPEGFDGEELKLMIYPDQPMRIGHNAYPNSRQNICTKSGNDISIAEQGWTSVNFVYDSTLLGGSWLVDHISSAGDERIIGKKTVGNEVRSRVLENPSVKLDGMGFLTTFRNQNGAAIGYIKSAGSGLPGVVTIRNACETYLSGMEEGIDGQQVTLQLNAGRGLWLMLHNYNSPFCYGCLSAAGFTPKLPLGIKPLLLGNFQNVKFYKSRKAIATLVYDAELNGGVWKLVEWSKVF